MNALIFSPRGCACHSMKIRIIRSRYLSLAATLLGILIAAAANAGIVLTLNTVDKTFSLSGSDTGGMSGIFPWGAYTEWNVTVPNIEGAVPGDYRSYDNDVAFTTSIGTPGHGGLYDTVIGIQGGSMGIKIGTSVAGSQTITGTGAWQSYEMATPGGTAQVEAAIGKTMGNLYSEWPTIEVVGVPEPSTYALLAVCIALIGAIVRRRRVRYK